MDVCAPDAGTLSERRKLCANGCAFLGTDGTCQADCGGQKYERAVVDGVAVFRCF